MYCSSCGAAVVQNLNYCNRCGAKVDAIDRPAELSPNSLVNAIVAVFVLGLGAIIVLMALMRGDPIILAAAMLSFLLMLVIEGVLIGLLLKGKRGAKEAGGTERLKEQTTRELEEARTRALAEPVPSVTEHTTRAFEPIYNERESK